MGLALMPHSSSTPARLMQTLTLAQTCGFLANSSPSLTPMLSGAPSLTSSQISCRTLEKSSRTTSSPGRSLCWGLPPEHRACEKFRLSPHLHGFPHFSFCWL